MVEAAGIEPASAKENHSASTCLSRRFLTEEVAGGLTLFPLSRWVSHPLAHRAPRIDQPAGCRSTKPAGIAPWSVAALIRPQVR